MATLSTLLAVLFLLSNGFLIASILRNIYDSFFLMYKEGMKPKQELHFKSFRFDYIKETNYTNFIEDQSPDKPGQMGFLLNNVITQLMIAIEQHKSI